MTKNFSMPLYNLPVISPSPYLMKSLNDSKEIPTVVPSELIGVCSPPVPLTEIPKDLQTSFCFFVSAITGTGKVWDLDMYDILYELTFTLIWLTACNISIPFKFEKTFTSHFFQSLCTWSTIALFFSKPNDTHIIFQLPTTTPKWRQSELITGFHITVKGVNS